MIQIMQNYRLIMVIAHGTAKRTREASVWTLYYCTWRAALSRNYAWTEL